MESTKDFTLQKPGEPFFKWSWKSRVLVLYLDDQVQNFCQELLTQNGPREGQGRRFVAQNSDLGRSAHGAVLEEPGVPFYWRVQVKV